MYCLPYPQASDITSLRVPYIATCTYSLDGRYTFDSFYGSKISEELPGLPRGLVNATVRIILQLTFRPPSAPIVQSWLFFGLASEALGRDVAHDEFLETCPAGTSETSIDLRIPLWFLSELKARWRRLQDTLSTDDYEQKKKEFKQCFDLVWVVLACLEHMAEAGDAELSLVLLSVHVLMYLISDIFDSAKLLKTSLESKSTQLLVRRMLKNGWCRKRLNFIKSTSMFYPTLYFMSSFRPQQGKHEDHQSCTPAKCFVTTGLVEPLHRTNNCECEDVVVPLEEVLKIVAAGGIPLIRIGRSPSEEINLEVVPYTRTTRFTAISHVWADRQLGSATNRLPTCQVEYLGSMLAALPRQVDDWRLRDWFPQRSPTSDPIEPPSCTYEFFWLDTFCIPQDTQHAELKYKAIGSMNLIYAAAAQTLVFDSGLQKLDAGQRPSSLAHGGRPAYYAPTDKNLVDVLAHLCASNWMGRAWTLQEGVLSGHIIFPLKGSLAYLRLLKPGYDKGFSLWDLFPLGTIKKLLNDKPTGTLLHVEDEAEVMQGRVRYELFNFAQGSLNVKEYRKYSRGSADRAERFVNAHSLLQSRTTTMAQDLPLILMNMSGMNGNLASQSDSSDQKMKLLFYGLGTLPVELLFSECERFGCCEVDSWIPREVFPETFSGEHLLRLTPEGFTFHHQKGDKPLKFFLISRSVVWQDQVLLSISDRPEDKERRYVVKAATSSAGQHPASSTNGWCILLEDDSTNPRAARFIISRRNGNKAFLHFDCPLRLAKVYDDNPKTTGQRPSYTCIARPADSQEEFIIEKSPTPQSLSMPRPQNPEQYGDRLIVIHQALYFGAGYLERTLLRWLLGDMIDKNWLVIGIYGAFTFMQREWIERALHAFVHRAWLETYSPTWNPNGPWKWFWKLSNYEPPIPFMTMMKLYCQLMFSLCMLTGFYSGLVQITLYWFVCFPKEELLGMYVIGLVGKAVFSFFL